jgi:hypothetical protein
VLQCEVSLLASAIRCSRWLNWSRNSSHFVWNLKGLSHVYKSLLSLDPEPDKYSQPHVIFISCNVVAFRLKSFTRVVSAPSVSRSFKKRNWTPWLWYARELYRPSDRRLSAKLVPAFADRGYCVVSATGPQGRILAFLDRPRSSYSPLFDHSCTKIFIMHYAFFLMSEYYLHSFALKHPASLFLIRLASQGWQPYRHLCSGCLGNVGSSTSHNPVGLHSLLRG